MKRSPSLPSASCFRAALRAAGLFLPASKAFRVSRKSVRLACVRHAASVRPEPGSNSLKMILKQPFGCFNQSQSSIAHSMLAHLCTAPFPKRTHKFSIKTYQKNLRVPCLFRCLIFKVRCLLKKGRFVSYHIIAALSTPFFQPVRFFSGSLLKLSCAGVSLLEAALWPAASGRLCSERKALCSRALDYIIKSIPLCQLLFLLFSLLPTPYRAFPTGSIKVPPIIKKERSLPGCTLSQNEGKMKKTI